MKTRSSDDSERLWLRTMAIPPMLHAPLRGFHSAAHTIDDVRRARFLSFAASTRRLHAWLFYLKASAA
jgi:hypothetical protein